jgi:hypothetical protein
MIVQDDDDEHNNDEPQIVPNSSLSESKTQAQKRSHPFASSPSTRRSKRGRADFVPTCLADDDDDETSLPKDYTAAPTPEYGGKIRRR